MKQKDTNRIITVGYCEPINGTKIHKQGWVYDIDGVCCCLTGRDYKDPCKILMEED